MIPEFGAYLSMFSSDSALFTFQYDDLNGCSPFSFMRMRYAQIVDHEKCWRGKLKWNFEMSGNMRRQSKMSSPNRPCIQLRLMTASIFAISYARICIAWFIGLNRKLPNSIPKLLANYLNHTINIKSSELHAPLIVLQMHASNNFEKFIIEFWLRLKAKRISNLITVMSISRIFRCCYCLCNSLLCWMNSLRNFLSHAH